MLRRPVRALTRATLRLAGLAAAGAATAGACAVSFDGYHLQGSGGGAQGGGGATGSLSSSGSAGGAATVGSSASAGGTTSSSAGHTSASSTSASSTSASTGGCGGTLDPNLALPETTGQTCTVPMANGCPPLENCRPISPCGGYCEGCTTCLGHGAACVADKECAVPDVCYKGKCAPLCQLNTANQCATGKVCQDVGYLWGVCGPY